MNKIIMNKILILSILTLSFLVCSCNEDIIDLVPIGDTEATFYQNEEQMDMAVFSIYQKNCWFYMHRGSQDNSLQMVTILPSDDATTPQTGKETENFVGLSGGTGIVNDYYQYTYQLIARANVVLQKIEENGEFAYSEKPERKDWNKGEALFLRAYAHFNLWNIYGTAPKVTMRNTNLDEAYLPNSVGTELLDQAIDDLEEAAKLLPSSWDSEFKGRVTKNSAHGLRGKALVFRGLVNNAQADFSAAIANFNAISGLSLTARYGENFEVTFENNEESLFEYQANNNLAASNMWLTNDEFSVIGEIGHYTGYFNQKPDWVGNMFFSATSTIKNAYEDGDPRKSYNINLSATGNVNIMKYVRVTKEANGLDWGTGLTINNPRILRYADVLLLKAEAIVRSNGSLSEAIGLINQVHERARNSDESGTPSAVPADKSATETDRNTVLEWVFQERRLELAFEEGHRWWDLRRRHIVGEIDLKTLDFGSLDGSFKFDDKNIYFPLPSREVVDNPNLDQNKGY